MLSERARHGPWTSPHRANELISSLFSLPFHLRQDVLCRCLHTNPLVGLIHSFSDVLAPSLIAAATSANGELALQVQDSSSMLVSLAASPIPPPGLLRLAITWEIVDPMKARSAAALVAHAAACHPTLQQLTLDTVHHTPDWLIKFSSCIPPTALPNLRHLNLMASAEANAYAAVSRCLGRLTQLSHVGVDLTFRPGAPECSPLSTLTQAAASPAVLNSLHTAEMHERHGSDCDTDEADGRPATESCIPHLLPLLRAPAMTSLSIESEADNVSAPRLLALISTFPALRALHMNAELHVLDPVVHAQTATAQVAPLQELHLVGACPAGPLSVAAAIAARTSDTLTSLEIDAGDVDGSYACTDCTVRHAQAAWGDLLAAVQRCSALQRLHLGMLSAFVRDDDVLAFSQALAHALGKLSGLTRLCLQAEFKHGASQAYGMLCAEVLATALRGMAELRSLELTSGQATLKWRPGRPSVQHLLDACAELTRLTKLSLSCAGVHRDAIVALIPKLPALEELGVGREHVAGDADGGLAGLAGLAAQFPAITVSLEDGGSHADP